jgi:hypothetical protein
MAVIGYEIICGLSAGVEEGDRQRESTVIHHRASGNQPVALISQLIDQFSILTKVINCAVRGSPQYKFTQTYQLYLFLVELNN